MLDLCVIRFVQKKSDRKKSPSKPLDNDRREKFCQLIIDGVKPSEAYKKAYKCSQEVATASVSRMLGYADVKARIDYLRDQLAEDKANRRKRKLAVCEDIWSGKELKADVSDKLRAIDIDNKMCGDYEPTKIDLGEVGDALAGIIVSPEILEAAAQARRETFAKIRARQEASNGK